tara:strand:+ start:541 stop:1500 length:960 start_codon:yes stop_codon:yes gene_type:complete
MLHRKNEIDEMKNLVTGGAGFLGSHLIDNLIKKNEQVICLDNFYTGTSKNIEKWLNHPNFKLVEHDITDPIRIETDKIWHLACPASPVHYQLDPIKTARTSFLGTYNMLELAIKVHAKILFASSSEIYGNSRINPQNENYHGNVNPIGLRSCYDEGKRIAETLCADYKRIHNLDIRIIRIFNTYGPKMKPGDGRVVSDFIHNALRNKPLTVYGDGRQTRSFCYVDDLIEGMISLMESEISTPINIGNPNELKIIELANKIKNKINPNLKIIFKKLPQDDPIQRQPDITKAKKELGWQPKTLFEDGLDKTINWYREILKT